MPKISGCRNTYPFVVVGGLVVGRGRSVIGVISFTTTTTTTTSSSCLLGTQSPVMYCTYVPYLWMQDEFGEGVVLYITCIPSVTLDIKVR